MENFERFYNFALRFLSYRPRSEQEIRNKLKEKRAESEIIEKIVAKLKKYNFINDLEFAKKWAEERMQFKPRSWRLIKIELRHKGISEEIIESIIHDSQFMIQSDLEQAKKLVEKRITRFRNPTSPRLRGTSKFGMTREKIYEKLGRYLASKGFDWDTIKKAIDTALS